jgi:hypothetical protein
MITIFAPEHSDQRPVRIWNRQLIGYAGHRQSDGSIVGDPLNVPLTEVVRKLGWTRDPAGPFDLLPLLIETSEGLRWFDWPEGLILEVPIRHPDHPWFEELQLKWFALPAVSGMLLQIGGVKYPAAPFSGWYVGTEVGARDLADIQRYNVCRGTDHAFSACGENFAAWRPKSETGRAPLFHFVARRSVQRRRRVFMVAFLRLACATLRLIARQPACSLISMIRFKPFAADTIANFSHLDAHPRFSFSSAGIPAQRARPDDPTGAFASAVEHRL